ncbi:MAG: hypothetical protein AAFM91_15205 [Pseudomonadota bacterium]
MDDPAVLPPPTIDTAAAHGEKLHAPLQRWKLALLLVLTLGVFAFYWCYRLARDLKVGGRGEYHPWLWFLAPLTGISYGIAIFNLAAAYREWAEATDARIVPVSNPMGLGLLAFVTAVTVNVTSGLDVLIWPLLVAMLASFVPLLVLQGQVNAIKEQTAPEFRTPPMRFTWVQRVVVGVLALAWIPIAYFSLELELQQLGGQRLAQGTVIEDPAGNFSLRLPSAGWVQIEPGYSSTDADVELLLADYGDWAAIWYGPDRDLQSIADWHIEWVRGQYADEKASCSEDQSVDTESFNVISRVECTGSTLLLGRYVVLSHAISDGRRSVEIVVAISDLEKRLFEKRRSYTNIASGLRLHK